MEENHSAGSTARILLHLVEFLKKLWQLRQGECPFVDQERRKVLLGAGTAQGLPAHTGLREDWGV